MSDFSPFRLDSENQCLWRGSERVPITPKAFSLLEYMTERPGRLVTHSELLKALWPDSFVQQDVLKTHILDIRHALGDDAKAPKFIETHARRGYRFIAPISNAVRGAPRNSTSRHSPLASIAVLAFANLDGHKESEYFWRRTGRGYHQRADQNHWSQSNRPNVGFRVQKAELKISAPSPECSASPMFLEGSVRTDGNRVRVTAQLITASDGSHLWSGRFDRDVNDILTIQDEIAQSIATALRTKLRGPGERRPANAEAYHAYLEGRYYVQQVTPKAIERALEGYRRAITLDPGYALPHSGLALQAYYRVLYLAGNAHA